MEESGHGVVDIDDEKFSMAFASSSCGGGGKDGRCRECWTYEGEGGRHAVFSMKNRGLSAGRQEQQPVVASPTTKAASGESSSPLRPFVLRVRKGDLVEIAAVTAANAPSPREEEGGGGGGGGGDERSCCSCGLLSLNEVKQRRTNREPAPDAEEGSSNDNNGTNIKVEDPEILRLHRFLEAIVLPDDDDEDDDGDDDDDDGGDGRLRDEDDGDKPNRADDNDDRGGGGSSDSADQSAEGCAAAAAAAAPSSGGAGPAAAPPTEATSEAAEPDRRRGGGAVSGAYVDRPMAVPLTRDLARTLRRVALASGCIPPSRIKDWHDHRSDPAEAGRPHEPEDDSSALPESRPQFYGLRIPDYRVLPPPSYRRTPSSSSSYLSVSLEIKPKAGYRAYSPLVHPERRSKYQQSRFVLLQRLWSQGYIEKNWATAATTSCCDGSGGSSSSCVTPSPSRYDPLDLFSNDPSRILAAIRALAYETPQNNAKLTIDGRFVALGGRHEPQDQQGAPPTTEWSRQVHRALRLPEGSDAFAPLCAEVLRVEPLLSQILRLQLLDVLDGDGALLVYRHMVDRHCGGSRTKAEHLVDALEEDENDDSTHGDPPPHPLLAASPFVAPSDTSRIAALCEIVERTRQCLEAPRVSPNDTRDSAQLDVLHREAVGLVGALTKDDCVYLLRNWLLSLAMCDVSFFLTVTCDDRGDGEDERDTNETLASDSDGASCSRIVVVRRQTKKASGLVSVEWSAVDGVGDGDSRGSPAQVLWRRHRRTLRYQIKVIDCEPKPAKKLRGREAKEAPFSRLQDLN